MSTKEYAMYVLDSLSEEELNKFIATFANDNILARMETEMMLRNPHSRKYDNLEDLFQELDNEI